MVSKSKIDEAIRVFRNHNRVLRTTQALREGIHRRTLYSMLDNGIVERVARGLYRLSDLPRPGSPDLVSVGLQAPNSVICLISALAFHEITTQIPHTVYIALPRGARRPKLDHPPISKFWFKGPAFTEGIETHDIDGVSVRVYGPEKTLADCFKHRNKIGLDVALEALKLYRKQKPLRVDELVRYAKICRVGKIMRPCLEAVL